MAEGKFCLKQPTTRHDTYKSMQYRPALKIQSQIFNESSWYAHRGASVSIP